jgi:hypothetical protein
MIDVNYEIRRAVVCVAEDRKSHEPLLRLLLASLSRHANFPITVFYPEANQEFLHAIHALDPKIDIRLRRIEGAQAWDVKPRALLRLLDEGYQQVLWLDSDVLATKHISLPLLSPSPDGLLVAEEALWGERSDAGAKRARMWGFPVGRIFPFVLNTAVLRVTAAHRPLLNRWRELLETPDYQRAQGQPWHQRQLHMLGDQDVLTALLSSQEFCAVPVEIMRRGRDVIQYFGPFGFTLAERMKCLLHGMPTFIHAQGAKPWLTNQAETREDLRGTLEATYQDLSPYLLLAEKLEPKLAKTWIRPCSKLSVLFRMLGLGYPPLVGLPLAAVFDLARSARVLLAPFNKSR